ncbi:hypothetical protein M5E06_13320 [Azospirillum sp. A1-3]|uniref:hypothetical protein n=1 Tax=Azospirillum sp. A1-3 TaxID=185874 RepID=UPI0020776E4E|nr:hypothetical protein [Azospirillum sp. A1-3]MCM8735163.1 hypothetical protein [Azospirillum sp. A1-3]
MKLSPEALETMGESANDGLIHPYVWGPALVGAAQQIKELQAAISTAEADRKAIMEVVRQLSDPNNWNANRNMWVRPDDPVRLAASVLRSEAEGKGTP